MKKKVNKQRIKLDIPVWYLDYWKENTPTHLPANQTFELVIDYPISEPVIFEIKTGKKGLGIVGILNKIGKSYKHIYANLEKYGVWGHSMDDLAIEGIDINYQTKTIRLQVGS